MLRKLIIVLFFIQFTSLFSDWNQWRGSIDGNGIIEKQNIVQKWNDNENILWRSIVPGKGHSSPVIRNGKIFLTTADLEKSTQSLLCYDQASGKKLWESIAFKGELMKVKHPQSDHAAATPVVDEDVVICSFGIDNSNWLVAFDFDGKLKWKNKLSNFKSVFGMGSSPLLNEGKVYVLQDNEPQNFIACYSINDGKEIWRINRKLISKISYSTPRIFKFKGKNLLIVNSLYFIAAYNPENGEEIWNTKGEVQTTVGTPVLVGDKLFCTGGYPEKVTLAYQLNGTTAKLLWKNKFNSYISSLIAIENEIYVGNSKGFLACIDQKSGKINWKLNLKGKDIIASPYYANEKLYVSTIKGITKVIDPDSTKYIELESNTLEGAIFASAAIVDNKIYQRTHGYLYCIGKK